MNMNEMPPSKQWASLKYRGQLFAEVWFKPDELPGGLIVRIPCESFRDPLLAPILTIDNLLKALRIDAQDLDRLEYANNDQGSTSLSPATNSQPLPPPAHDVPHLVLHFLFRQAELVTGSDGGLLDENQLAKWHDVQGRWNGILGLEAKIDSLRQAAESARSELETLSKRSLTPEEKLHAISSDVAQLTKAKMRAQHSLPRGRDFVQRAIWALATPERKELGDLMEELLRTGKPTPEQLDHLSHQLENLLKERQILSSQGQTVGQECKSMSNDIRTVITTLQTNAASRARQKKNSSHGKGK